MTNRPQGKSLETDQNARFACVLVAQLGRYTTSEMDDG